jgi:hypothetical protein
MSCSSLLEAYRRHKTVAAQAERARQSVQAFVAECDRMGTLQSRAVAAISGHQLAKWEQEAAALLEQSLGRGKRNHPIPLTLRIKSEK